MEKAFINWSGGKDCTLALYHVLKEKKYNVEFLFTTVSQEFERVSMHGVRKELITRQRFSLTIPSRKLYLPSSTSHEMYNERMKHEMSLMKQRGITNAIFGDIFLEDLRVFREKQMESVGMKCIFPLWKRESKELAKEFIDLGFKAIVVCVSGDKLDKSFAGRLFDESFIADLPPDVDVCGENGEFHTFVFDGPIFINPVKFLMGETVHKEYETNDPSVKSKGFWFTDLIPAL
jgi:uncharacterized protein (TIGR00290 family)